MIVQSVVCAEQSEFLKLISRWRHYVVLVKISFAKTRVVSMNCGLRSVTISSVCYNVLCCTTHMPVGSSSFKANNCQLPYIDLYADVTLRVISSFFCCINRSGLSVAARTAGVFMWCHRKMYCSRRYQFNFTRQNIRQLKAASSTSVQQPHKKSRSEQQQLVCNILQHQQATICDSGRNHSNYRHVMSWIEETNWFWMEKWIVYTRTSW